jgi:hypothetical protein
MEAPVEHRLVDEDGKKRLMAVVYAGLWSLVLLTALVTVTHHLIEPQYGWLSSLGVGGLVGFWVSILVAGVAGNGYYELRYERHSA